MSANKTHYQRAAEEMSPNLVDAGLWAMAKSEALNDLKKAQAIYIRLRAEDISKQETQAKLTKAIAPVVDAAKSGAKDLADAGNAIGTGFASIFVVFAVIMVFLGLIAIVITLAGY